jgi:nitroimidazol reductase NimA-like FMN-containing flavoprotein (pyridoxamine 5'-phosphate oxidase superfamily)
MSAAATSLPATPPSTPRVRVRRHAERAAYDRETVDAILDEALLCHLGVIVDGQPVVMPTLFARDGDTLYLHGAAANRSLRAATEAACVTVSLMDGVVLARTPMNHSVNYRSVVVLGRGRLVTDPAVKQEALRAVIEHTVPGRCAEVPEMSPADVAATTVIAIDLDEVSAKVRTGPPADPEADRDLPVWAGVIPLRVAAGDPEPDPHVPAGMATPASVAAVRRRFPARAGPPRVPA